MDLIKLYKLLAGLTLGLFAYTAIAAQGPLLPDHRIVGYYGNFNSAKMGVLGEYPPDQVLKMLEGEVAKWQAADPSKKVIPAIEYIAVVAQKDAGTDGNYNGRMSDAQIQKAIDMANQVNGIAILDVQVGLSSVRTEVPLLAAHLAKPNVMLGLDPEFDMFGEKKPGGVIGTMSASDINYAIDYLANLVRTHNLPPKVLVVHRFTQKMITDAHLIKPVPEVQVIINMDGWGPPTLKTDSYNSYVGAQPVQYTGIKLFYKNDKKPPSTGLMTPSEILNLKPKPLFILYQ
ncbi:MAG: hypothetical protein WC748_08805 [Legionellales bacterium]